VIKINDYTHIKQEISADAPLLFFHQALPLIESILINQGVMRENTTIKAQSFLLELVDMSALL